MASRCRYLSHCGLEDSPRILLGRKYFMFKRFFSGIKSIPAKRRRLFSKIKKSLYRRKINSFIEACSSGQMKTALEEITSKYSPVWAHYIGGQVFIGLCEAKGISIAYDFKKALAIKLIEQLASVDRPTQKQTKILMAAYLYLEKFEEINENQSRYFSGAEYVSFLSDAATTNNRKETSRLKEKLHNQHFSHIHKSWSNLNFFNLINGKRVCFVGPAATEIEEGAAIDDFDVIVRINFTSPEDIAGHEKTHGSLTHITYINGMMHKFLPKESFLFFQEHELHVVFRNSAYKKIMYKYFKKSVDDNIRQMLSLPLVFGSDRLSYFGLQRIILDLLAFMPKSIYIYNVDFFTNISNSMHIAGYKTAGMDFYEHDPLQSLRVTRYLFKSGLISGDEIFEHIMGWTDDQYLARLDEIYKSSKNPAVGWVKSGRKETGRQSSGDMKA